MMPNMVKQKLKNGQCATGCFIGFHSPSVVEILGHTGFDFVVIDNEHGPFSWGEVEEMIRAAELAGTVPIVRVAYDKSDIQKALDRGAMGLHVPMVNTKEEAEEVVQKAKYPPVGRRGTAYSCRSAQYGKGGGAAYLQQSNEEILIAVHIETPEAVDHIDEIMSVPGIDICYIGPTDLSVTMGYSAEGPEHPEVQQAMDRVMAAGRKHGVTVGIQVASAPAVTQKQQWGAPYIGIAITPVLYNALGEVVKAGNPLSRSK
ncbi:MULTISPECIES: HpcH/HpaI aldolase/citrate lyase family protein [unclassified Paenibacillus]|uniref:HpcH/HpaI aldolase family protein n=1 Tax=Paenibacillus TaxID=44249 RepID=UPI0020C6E5C3|nr:MULTISPECIES: aldolase/citrate lyase family protein [unclassified Paenibacillus]